ncbi:MAG: hypothetical protein JW940_22105 [Polyangiaceae bacterium]|nr:hypothetical protein [Polyangiaceae bacterium]
MSTKKKSAASAQTHKWEFKARFRRNAFGWKSQPAITRVKQAVAEIKKVAKKEPLLAAEGAVVFLERVSPALEYVDSSSGAIGTAVNNAIADLVPIIANAPAEAKIRDAWLERLFDAYQDDGIPYIEWLGDHWGTLCASREVASAWADQLIDGVKLSWSPDPSLRGFFKGTTNCLIALVAAERYDDVLTLLELAPYKMWHYRQYGVKAFAAQGKKAEAICYAEEGRGLNDTPWRSRAPARRCFSPRAWQTKRIVAMGSSRTRRVPTSPPSAPSRRSTRTRRRRRSWPIWWRRHRATRAGGSPLPRMPGSTKRRWSLPVRRRAIRRR